MSVKLKVHLRGDPSENWVEVDGRRVEAHWVNLTFAPGKWAHLTLETGDVEIVDEREGDEAGKPIGTAGGESA